MANTERAKGAMKGVAKQIINFPKLARVSTVVPIGKRGNKAVGRRGR